MAWSNGKDSSENLHLTHERVSEAEDRYASTPNIYTLPTERIIRQYRQVVLPVWSVWLVIALMTFMLLTQMWVVNTITKIYSLVAYQTGILEQQKKEDKK